MLENRDQAHKAIYQQALTMIQHYVTAQEVIRITTDMSPSIEEDQEITVNQSIFTIQDGEPKETVINDLDAYEYDVQIADEPYSASAQEDRLEKLGAIFEATKEINPERANAMLPIIVKAMGTPESDEVLKAWKDMETPDQTQQQLAQMMQQLQMIMAKLGVEEKQLSNQGLELDNMKKAQEIQRLQIENVFAKFLPEKTDSTKKQDETKQVA